VIEKLCICFLAHAAVSMEISHHYAGINCVYSYPFRGEFECGAAGELIDAGLAYAVSQNTGNARVPVTLETFTKLPLRLITDGSASCIIRKTELRLISIISFH